MAKRPSKYTILFADDEPDLLWGLGRHLLRSGFSVITCLDGAEAVEMLKKRDFDLLITDLLMPKLDGFGLLD
ncbi:MAG: response regulator, partial [Pseudomonadota bacterium]